MANGIGSPVGSVERRPWTILSKVQGFSFTQAVEDLKGQNFSPCPVLPRPSRKSRNPRRCPCRSPAKDAVKNIKNKVWKALFVTHPATMAFSAERSKSVLQRLKTKSEAGIRSIPVPDFVLDEMTNIQTDENGDLYWEKI